MCVSVCVFVCVRPFKDSEILLAMKDIIKDMKGEMMD